MECFNELSPEGEFFCHLNKEDCVDLKEGLFKDSTTEENFDVRPKTEDPFDMSWPLHTEVNFEDSQEADPILEKNTLNRNLSSSETDGLKNNKGEKKVKLTPNDEKQSNFRGCAVEKVSPKPQIFVCGRCNKIFTKKKSLEEHFVSWHLKNSQYLCDNCGVTFSSYSNLGKHLSSGECDPLNIVDTDSTTPDADVVNLSTKHFVDCNFSEPLNKQNFPLNNEIIDVYDRSPTKDNSRKIVPQFSNSKADKIIHEDSSIAAKRCHSALLDCTNSRLSHQNNKKLCVENRRKSLNKPPNSSGSVIRIHMSSDDFNIHDKSKNLPIIVSDYISSPSITNSNVQKKDLKLNLKSLIKESVTRKKTKNVVASSSTSTSTFDKTLNSKEKSKNTTNVSKLDDISTNLGDPESHDHNQEGTTRMISSDILSNITKTTEVINDCDVSHHSNTSSFSKKSRILSNLQKLCLNKKVNVMYASNKPHMRVYDKQFACIYCQQLQSKLYLHLQVSHSSEREVKEFLKYPKRSASRASIIRKLRNKGNYIHNFNVLRKCEGYLLVCRRATIITSPDTFLPCQYCLGFYQRKLLWKHGKFCPDRKKETLPSRLKIQSVGILLTPCTEKTIELAQKHVLQKMSDDGEPNFFFKDSLLVKFTAKRVERFKGKNSINREVKVYVRYLTRLLLYMSKHHGFTELSHCVMGENFFLVYNVVKNSVQFRSSILKIGHFLRECAIILIAECIIQNERTLLKKVENFLCLYKNYWKDIRELKPKAPIMLLSSERVLNFIWYIIRYEKHAVETNFENANYHDLLENTLAHIISFNCLRPESIQELQIVNYDERVKNRKQLCGMESLILYSNEFETFRHLECVTMVGNEGRETPVFLTQDMIKCIQSLLNNREKYGVPENNNYVFALPEKENYLRGLSAIQKIAKLCGIDFIKTFVFHKFRKKMSILTQMLNLKSHELQKVADNMEHSLSMPDEFYRLPEQVFQESQMSESLLTLTQNILDSCTKDFIAEFSPQCTNIHPVHNVSSKQDSNHEYLDSSLFEGNQNTLKNTNNVNVDNFEISSEEEQMPSTPIQKNKNSNSKEVTHQEDRPATNRQKRRKSQRLYWSKVEKELLWHEFKTFILEAKTPGISACTTFLEKYPQFKERRWSRIKYAIHNMILKRLRVKSCGLILSIQPADNNVCVEPNSSIQNFDSSLLANCLSTLNENDDENTDSSKLCNTDSHELMPIIKTHDFQSSDSDSNGVMQEEINDSLRSAVTNGHITQQVKKKSVGRVCWTEHEKKILLHAFKNYIAEGETPNKTDCLTFLRMYPQFKERDWVTIKWAVLNIIEEKCRLNKIESVNNFLLSEKNSSNERLTSLNVNDLLSSDEKNKINNTDIKPCVDDDKKIKLSKKSRASIKVSWSKHEKDIVSSEFKTFIAEAKIPGKSDCSVFLEKYPQFKERGWAKIKYAVYNMIQTHKKSSK